MAGYAAAMPEPGDMDERVTAVENSVSELRARVRRAEEDAAAARHLASGADRDTAELRGELREFRTQNNRVLNAMRGDLTGLRADLTDFRSQVQQEFAQVDRNFLAIRGVLDGLAAGVQYLTEQKAPGG
jgi:chromosome segregation ATPase